MHVASWREADIRQKEAEAELVGKAAILSDLKGGDGGNCLARRTTACEFPSWAIPAAGRFRRSSSRKSEFEREMIVVKGCSASGAGTNPPRRSFDPIAIPIPEFRSAGHATDT